MSVSTLMGRPLTARRVRVRVSEFAVREGLLKSISWSEVFVCPWTRQAGWNASGLSSSDALARHLEHNICATATKPNPWSQRGLPMQYLVRGKLVLTGVLIALLLMLAYSAPAHAQEDEPVHIEEPIPEPVPDYMAACDALPVLCQGLLQAWEDMKNAPPPSDPPAIGYETLLPSGDALAKYPRDLQVSIKAAKHWKSLQWFVDSCLDGTLPMNFEFHRYEVPGKAMLWGGGPRGNGFLFPDWTWTPYGSGGNDGMPGTLVRR